MNHLGGFHFKSAPDRGAWRGGGSRFLVVVLQRDFVMLTHFHLNYLHPVDFKPI